MPFFAITKNLSAIGYSTYILSVPDKFLQECIAKVVNSRFVYFDRAQHTEGHLNITTVSVISTILQVTFFPETMNIKREP